MTDHEYMLIAIAEAKKGWGNTHLNPLVGAIIVEDGMVVSGGYHAKYGGPHAEIEALNNLGRKPNKGAVLYVTLEPCCSKGKTCPCTDAILESGLKKVVIGAIDPDERHRGRGIEILKSAGVETTAGVLQSDCEDLNLLFNHVAKTGEPLIAGKTATTLDGKVSTRTGSSQWITGEIARRDVMRWRRLFPAIAVGSGTVLADNPSLTSRLDDLVTCGTRFVFDRRLRTRTGLDSLHVFTDSFKDKTVVVTNDETAEVSDFEERGIQVWKLHGSGIEFWITFKKRCTEDFLNGVYFEGGPCLLSDLLAHRQLNYLFAYRAPKFLADNEAPVFLQGQSIANMGDAFTLGNVQQSILGDDQLMRGFINYSPL